MLQAAGSVLLGGALVLLLVVVVLYRRYVTVERAAHQALRDLKETERRLGAVVETAPVVLFALDRAGRFTLSVGRGLAEIGLEPGQAVGRSVYEMYADVPEILDCVTRALGGVEAHSVVDVLGKTFDTKYVPTRGPDGTVSGLIGVATDVTERHRMEQDLALQALHDPLTRLPNRLLFVDRLQQALLRARRDTGKGLAVLVLDLDRFKLVNESFGHLVGDELMAALATRFRGLVQPGDTVARLSGDEFALLLEGLESPAQASEFADHLLAQLRHPIALREREVFATASIGIAVSEGGDQRPEDLLREADTAMSRAKVLGRGRHVTFDSFMHEQASALLRVETDLRRAIQREEFVLHYQPLVSLETGRLRGFEALLRWQHPEQGLLLPADFMVVAEETGLIVPIGRWVLRSACAQMRAWLGRHPEAVALSVVVNLSGRQWAQPRLVEEIEQLLAEYSLAPANLSLEIVESVLMENPEAVASTLEELRDNGIRVFLDDFGTGYSSLSALHMFPVDALKIDRSFVARMGLDARHAEVVRTIVLLGHNLGKRVVAEGIETKAQRERLKEYRCEYGQGHLFSAPLDAEDATALIRTRKVWS